MRFEDASQAGSFDNQSMPVARADADALAAGSMGPASGNVITGAGTITGAAGADTPGDAPARIVSLQGAGGGSSSTDGTLQAAGQFGQLSMDGQGGYNYVRTGGAPDGGVDVFTYTLADRNGDRASAQLTITFGKEDQIDEASAAASALQAGIVNLPAGVELSDIRVVGRDLVVTLPDGSLMTIPGGAVFVPQLVIGDVQVPPTNVAALLIDSEPQPAAGNPQSSGGNFAVEVGPLDPGVALGDLIPPTQLVYAPPEFEDVGQFIDNKPEIFIIPDGGVQTEAALDSVDESGLPARPVNEPAGSNAAANSETTVGTIVYSATDTPATISITVNGTTTIVTSVNQAPIVGQYGNLTITSISDGAIGYSYTLRDNTSGNTTHDDFLVTLTDVDGDTDSATLRIDIVDDVPLARPDTDSIAAGTFGPATGNVITDAAAGDAGDSDTNAADTVGADNATVTLVTGFGGSSDTTFDASGNLQVNGQYGVLLIKANGDYSYTRNANTPGGVTDTFNYTLTDGDTDTSSSTLTISIGDRLVTVGPNATVLTDDDAVPGANGNPGGTGDDIDAQNLSGTLSGSAGDGTLTFDLLTSGAPTGFSYVDGPNGSVLVQQVQSGTTVTVLTVTINATTGAYTVVQNAPVLVAGSDENNQSFTINYSVTDLDNDSAAGSLTINVDDDTPTINVTKAADAAIVLTTQDADTIGAASDTATSSASFGGVFALSSSAGADGAAAPALSYSLGVASSVSGLTSHGVAINLYNVGGTIVGSTAASAPASLTDASVIFTVAVGAGGVVTLTQLQQVDHAVEGTTTSPFDDQYAVLADGKITLTASSTITDRDGDPASDSEVVDLGGNIRFADDGPDVSAAFVASTTIRIDETDGVVAAGGEVDPIGGNLGTVTVARASYLTVTDPHVSADAPTSYSYMLQLGAVGEGGRVSSGLLLSTTNAPIYLYNVGGTIVGSTALSAPASVSDASVAFTVSLNASGDVTLTQILAVEHGTPGSSHDEDSSPLAAGALSVVVTATDFDGDTDTASVDLGSIIRFEDDGPSIDVTQASEGGVLLTTQDAQTIGAASDTDVSSASFSSVFATASNGGSDGTASVNTMYALAVASAVSGLSSHGVAVNLYNVGGTIVGSTAASAPVSLTDASVVFTVAVSGSGVVTLTQLQQVDHAVEGTTTSPFDDQFAILANGKITLTASSTITDNDGDTATDSELVDLGGNLRFADDGPTVTTNVEGPGSLFVSDANFSIDATGNFSSFFNFNFGADGAAASGSIAYTLGVNTTLPGGTGLSDTLTKLPIMLAVNPANGNVVGFIQTSPGVFVGVFAVSVDSSGNVTLNQFRAVYHSAGTYVAGADSDSPETLLNNGSITLTAKATDFDGDTASQTVGIGQMLQFGDDFPAVDITVLDDLNNFLITQDADTIGANTDFATSSGAFNDAFSIVSEDFGNDGPFNGNGDDAAQADVSLSLKVAEGTASGLTSGGVAIRMYIDANGVVIGSTAANEGSISAANTIFTIAVDGEAVVTLSQMAQIDHTTVDPSPTGTPFVDHVVSLPDGLVSLDVTYTITDGDLDTASDSASLDLGGNVRFADDGPSISVSATSEGGVELHTQDADTFGSASDTAVSTANFSGVFSAAPVSGADSPAGTPSWSYALGLTTGVSGLMSHGVAINLYNVGGTIVGSTALSAPLSLVDASIVFTASVNNSGIVTLTQYQQVDHALEGTTTAPFADQVAFILNDNAITLTGTATVTDFDGDTATNSATVGIANNLKFDDDGPDVSAALVSQTSIRIDETDGVVAAGGEVDPMGGNLGTVTVARSTYVTVSDPHVSADAPTAYSYTLQLGAPGGNGLVASGLLLSTTNAPIYLYNVGGTVVGSTALVAPTLLTDPSIAFTVAINASGDITLTQILAVEHYNTASFDEDSSPLAAGALSVVVTATDYDGDTDTASVDLGSIIRFEDDGPSINVAAATETGVLVTTQDGDTIGAAFDTATSSAAFGGVFTIASSSGGSDGAANTPVLSYALDVPGAGAAGIDSGLNQGNANIYLYEIGAKVVGSTSATLAGVVTGNIVFDVAVSTSGVVTLTQYSQIDHPAEGPPGATNAPFDDQLIWMTDNLVTLTASASITDNDGDTAADSETINIGSNLRFADHGPLAIADTNMVTEGGSTSGNVLTDGIDDSFGADGMGSIQGVAAGSNVGTPVSGGIGVPIVTSLGSLTLLAGGGYTYTSNDNSVTTTQVDSFVYTIVDADGDTSTVTLQITINPVTLNGDNQTKTVNEAAMDTAITGFDVAAGSVTGSQPGLVTETVTGQLTVVGAAPTGYVAQSVTTSYGKLVLNTDGSYTYTLTAPFDGPTLNNGTVTHPAVEQFTYTVFDVNGNSTTGTITIDVIDDIPSINVTKGAEVGVLLATQDAETIGGLTDFQQSSANFGGVFGLTYVAGADGAAVPTLSYTLGVPGAGANGVDSGLDQGANNIYLYTIGGKVVGSTSSTLAGVVVGNTVFDVMVNASGQVTLTQYSQIDHPVEGVTTAPFDDQFVSILDSLVTLTASSTITDNDGDQAPDSEIVNIGENLRFYDHGPTIDVTTGSESGITLTTQDTETDGTPTTQDSDTISFAGAFGLTSTPGADGAAAPVLSYSLGFQAGDSGLKSGGSTIYLYQIGSNIVGSTAALQTGVTGANTIFEVSVVASGVSAGSVTLTQYAQIDHTVLNPSNISLADAKITLTASSTITDFDGDTASDSATISIGANLIFQDDAPDISAATTGTQMRIDETDGVVAVGGEVDPAVGTNLGTVTLTAAQLYTVTNVNVSADSPTTYTYKLVVSNGADSGLDYSSTNASILLYQVSNTLVEGRVGGVGGAVAFSVSIDAASGATTLTQFLAVEHPTGGASHDEDSLPFTVNALQVEIKATDFDGDFDTALVDLGSIIRFEDDGPRVIAAQNMNINNGGDVAHTGAFLFNLGVDSPNLGFDDIKNVTMTINVNGTAVTATPVGVPTETLTTAIYTYSFSYATNSTGGTASNTVVVTFDKVGGTYTVDLTNPIQAFTTINSTSQATSFLGYDIGTTTQTNSQPDVVNVQLRADNPATVGVDESLWVRLTGLAGTPGTTSGDMNLTAGELITGGQSWVSASNTANGVGGDIVNSDEVLNIDLFTANQFGNATNTATTSASAVYFKLDNIGNSEDFIVNLKLWSDTDADGIVDAGETTTRAVYVANGDIVKGGGAVTAGPGQYSGVTLDNNDGLVIIENNDFNFGLENYRIIGAQIATTDQGLSGAAIDLNGAIGVLGFSTFDDNINFDSNNLGFKIQDIGFVSQTSTVQPATFTIAVTVGDADGDTTTQTLVATVTGAGDSVSTAAPAVVPPVVLDLDDDGVEFLSHAAGVAYDYNGDGVLESTGWVGADDGILVRDANGNGTVDNASEFVFGVDGGTDLQALASQYGSTLDSSDADFGQFAVWQDANSNGVADAGELQSLTALGIASVSLTSDGISYTAAGGDVTVAGSGTFTRADGSVGTLADASFATAARNVANDTLRLGTAANNNAALVAAIAAVGLASVPAAAEAPEAGATSDDLDTSAATSVSNLVSAIVSSEPDTQGLDALSESDDAGLTDSADAGSHSSATTMEVSRELADPSAEQDAPSELSAGTDAPTTDFASISIVADAMPSAEHLIAAAKGLEGEGAANDGATHLGDVLADALAGGEGHGPTIDALLDAVAEAHGAANSDAGASSPALSDVSMWHGGSIADYGSAQMALSSDAMQTHPDAVQAAA